MTREPSPRRARDLGPVPLVTMPLQVYSDRNGNGRFDAGEGVYGLQVILEQENGTQLAATTTRSRGVSSALLPRDARVLVEIPYLAWHGEVTATEVAFALRLPQVVLPRRIP